MMLAGCSKGRESVRRGEGDLLSSNCLPESHTQISAKKEPCSKTDPMGCGAGSLQGEIGRIGTEFREAPLSPGWDGLPKGASKGGNAGGGERLLGWSEGAPNRCQQRAQLSLLEPKDKSMLRQGSQEGEAEAKEKFGRLLPWVSRENYRRRDQESDRSRDRAVRAPLKERSSGGAKNTGRCGVDPAHQRVSRERNAIQTSESVRAKIPAKELRCPLPDQCQRFGGGRSTASSEQFQDGFRLLALRGQRWWWQGFSSWGEGTQNVLQGPGVIQVVVLAGCIPQCFQEFSSGGMEKELLTYLRGSLWDQSNVFGSWR